MFFTKGAAPEQASLKYRVLVLAGNIFLVHYVTYTISHWSRFVSQASVAEDSCSGLLAIHERFVNGASVLQVECKANTLVRARPSKFLRKKSFLEQAFTVIPGVILTQDRKTYFVQKW